MASPIFRTNDVIPIEAYIVDLQGAAATGLAAGAAGFRVLRKSDNQFLDWADDTFKAAGWTTLTQDLTEVDATNAPGVYEYVGGWDTGSIVNIADDDTYDLIFVNVSAGSVVLPAPVSLRLGQYVDSLFDSLTALNDVSIADVQMALTNQGYTAARALLLDNLDAAISSVATAIAALNDLSQADVQAAMTAQGYTAVRAALLDNLDTSVAAVNALVDDIHKIHGLDAANPMIVDETSRTAGAGVDQTISKVGQTVTVSRN